MENIDKKVEKFIAKSNKKKEGDEEVIVSQRDGLFERRELINPKLLTQDGRQLLREVRYEA